MMEGEDGESESEGSFNSKSVWARIAVVAAGPVFNFILAFLLALIVIGTAGFDRPEVKRRYGRVSGRGSRTSGWRYH